MKKILAVLVAILLLCGCSGGDGTTDNGGLRLTPVRGGEIRLFCDFPDTLNPIVTGYKSVSQAMDLLYDGLFRTENDFSATPVLASGYVALDGNKRYVVELKNDVKFHNGTSFGAEDVIATIDKIRKSQSLYNTNLINVASCSAKADGSVEFLLKEAQANFVNLLDFPILPSEVGDRDFLSENRGFYPEGTGKFKISTVDDDGITLVRNEAYFGEKPYVDSVKVTYIKDRSIAKYAFEAMEFDAITTDYYPWGETAMTGDFNTAEYESNRLVYLGFNCANPILSDSAVRRAVSVSLDKKRFVEELLYTHGVTTGSPVNPNAYFSDDAYVESEYEKGRSKDELKNAGWLDLDGDGILDKYVNNEQISLVFNIIVNSQNSVLLNCAHLIAENMLREGIKANIVELDYASYLAAVSAGQFDMFIGRTDIANDCNLNFLLKSGANCFNYNSENMYSALKDIESADGNKEIKAKYNAMDAVFREEMPFVPIYFENDALFTTIRVKGNLDISRTGVFTGLQNTFVKYKKQ